MGIESLSSIFIDVAYDMSKNFKSISVLAIFCHYSSSINLYITKRRIRKLTKEKQRRF